MTSFARKTDPRRRQYARFAQTVLETLREAVDRRTAEGLSRKEIAGRIDMAPSSLTRVLNGRVKNITIRTLSDILWAAEHEPVEFGSDAIEDICGNYRPSHLTRSLEAPSFQIALKSTNGVTMIEQRQLAPAKMELVE